MLKTFIIVLIIIIVWLLRYKIIYTIDYLIHRDSYTFKEEGQFKDNDFKITNNVLLDYLNYMRNEKIKDMPLVDAVPLVEVKIEDLNPDHLYEISKGFTKPFVVRGLIKDFDCVKKWNLEYFKKEYGNIEVLSFNDENSIGYSRDTSAKLKKCNKDNNLCTISQICDGIYKKEPLYINNISKLFTINEQARNELNLDKMNEIVNKCFLKEENAHKDVFISQLFLGGKNTGTSVHCAFNTNLFFNIKGEKHWILIDPMYTDLINCQSSNNGLFAVSTDDVFSESDTNPFLRIPRNEVILKSGDFLFNPTWYWHAVKNKTDYTIGVANRYDLTVFPSITNNIFFTFLQLFSPFYYIQNSHIYFSSTSGQEKYGILADKEIINNLTQDKSIKNNY